MSKKEHDRKLIARAQGGDVAAMQQLVCENLGLIWICIGRKPRRGFEPRSLLGEATIAFMRAIKQFDLSRTNVKLSTFVVTAVKNWLNVYIRNELRERNRTVDCPGYASYLVGEDSDVRSDHYDLLLRGVATLNRRERSLIRMKFAENKTYQEMSESLKLGLSRERMRQLVNRALSKIRTYLEENGFSDKPE